MRLLLVFLVFTASNCLENPSLENSKDLDSNIETKPISVKNAVQDLTQDDFVRQHDFDSLHSGRRQETSLELPRNLLYTGDITVSLSATGKRIAVKRFGYVRTYDLTYNVYTWNQIDPNVIYGSTGPMVLSGSGEYLAVAPSNRVQLYKYVKYRWTSRWTSQTWNVDNLGQAYTDNGQDILFEKRVESLAISYGGDYLAVGGSGLVRVYQVLGQELKRVGEDIPREYDNYSGTTKLSISDDGLRLVVGSPEAYDRAGSARVFEFANGQWSEIASYKGSVKNDRAGASVAISGNGKTVVVGAPDGLTDPNRISSSTRQGYVSVYDLGPDAGLQRYERFVGQEIGERSGSVVSVSTDGTIMAEGSQAGDVRVYEWSGEAWKRIVDYKESSYVPVNSISLSGDGTSIAIASNKASTYQIKDIKKGGGGGDPHFLLWNNERATFHGECDLVLVHSAAFHDNAGFDLYARTTIESFYSYIESGAFRVGNYTVEKKRDQLYLNGKKHTLEDLPLSFGENYKYTIKKITEEGGRRTFKVYLHEDSCIIFNFVERFLFIKVFGNFKDFSDSVGLLGEYSTGAMLDRDGSLMSDFEEFGFAWQVNPRKDPMLFRNPRAPQLPDEKCRMPSSTSRTSRRMLRANNKLLQDAKAACEAANQDGNYFDLCVDDIVATGDFVLAHGW